jgi:DNA-binding NtrC family response regulator
MALLMHTPLVAKRDDIRQIRRILVLDGNPNLRYIYMQTLHRAGYEAYPAATVQEARDLLLIYDFDVFLSDTHLDYQEQGVNLLREQMPILTKNNVKTVMMSSHLYYQLISQEMGVDAFVEKPVAIERLVSLIDRLVQERTDVNKRRIYETKSGKRTQLNMSGVLCVL